MRILPGWSDRDIMHCDLGRLQIAIDAAKQARDAEHDFLAAVNGRKINRPLPPPKSNEEFNDRVLSGMMLLGARPAGDG